MKTSRKFGREAREGAGIYPRHLLSSLLLPRTMTPTPRECAVESFPIHQSAVQRSLLSTPQLILLGKQYTDVGCSLAPWLNQTLQVEAIQQSGTLQCRHWCGNSWERVTLPGCGLGRHAVSRAKPKRPWGVQRVAPRLRHAHRRLRHSDLAVISILQHTPQATEPPISPTWQLHGMAHSRTENHNQVPSVGGLCGHSSGSNLLPSASTSTSLRLPLAS